MMMKATFPFKECSWKDITMDSKSLNHKWKVGNRSTQGHVDGEAANILSFH